MNSVKCKTEDMAARDYCLLWGCPGMVILTISLLVSLKVGNDFGQDNFAKFVTFVISNGIWGQSIICSCPYWQRYHLGCRTNNAKPSCF